MYFIYRKDIIRQYVVQMNRLKTHDKVNDLWFWNNKVHIVTKEGKIHHIMYGDSTPFLT